MTDPQEDVSIDPQQVSNGLAQWAAATESITSVRAKLAQITTAAAGNPWGGDEAGNEFRATFEKTGGLDLTETAEPPLKQVEDLGPQVRTAVENSLASDSAQGQAMDIDVQGL